MAHSEIVIKRSPVFFPVRGDVSGEGDEEQGGKKNCSWQRPPLRFRYSYADCKSIFIVNGPARTLLSAYLLVACFTITCSPDAGCLSDRF